MENWKALRFDLTSWIGLHENWEWYAWAFQRKKWQAKRHVRYGIEETELKDHQSSLRMHGGHCISPYIKWNRRACSLTEVKASIWLRGHHYKSNMSTWTTMRARRWPNILATFKMPSPNWQQRIWRKMTNNRLCCCLVFLLDNWKIFVVAEVIVLQAVDRLWSMLKIIRYTINEQTRKMLLCSNKGRE